MVNLSPDLNLTPLVVFLRFLPSAARLAVLGKNVKKQQEVSDSNQDYRQVSNIRRTLVGNNIVDHSDVVGASPVGAAPTTSSFVGLRPALEGFVVTMHEGACETGSQIPTA